MWQKIKNYYHLLVGILANILYFFPSRGLVVIGVTGTDGKTTTVSLIYHILKTNGKKVSMISSIGANVANKIYPTGFHVTTPGSFFIQNLLSKAKKSGNDYFVLETTSHAIDQNRIFGIKFEFGVLTNITNEHLDYHKTFENYVKTKEKLLQKAKIAIVNRDDSSYAFLKQTMDNKESANWITYGFSENSQVNLNNFDMNRVKIMGDFNKYNILAAVAVCRNLGIADDKILKSLETFDLPRGRLEFVYKKDFAVMIDFAHTPNSFEKLLKSLRPIIKGRIIHVFGSAGERDASKRPYLGELSSAFADIVILTAEDPRSENVNQIIDQIAAGVDNEKAEIIKIPDRKEAITAAIQMAKKNDLVLLTGKAQEESMNMGNGEEPWNEYKIVDDLLISLGLKNEKK